MINPEIRLILLLKEEKITEGHRFLLE